MRRVELFGRIAFGVLLLLHGAVHAMGMLGSWELAEFEGISTQPNVLLEDASDGTLRVLGVVWLVAGVLFIAAAFAVLRRIAGWPLLTLVAAVVSLAICLLWVDDAIAGVVLNVAILLGLAAWSGWSRWAPHHGHGGLPTPA